MPDVVRLCVLSKGHDGMPRLTSFDHVCCPKAMIHATLDVVRPFPPSKGDNGMPRLTPSDRLCCPKVMMACHARRRSTVCDYNGGNGMSRPTSFDRVRYPNEVMSCHARRLSTVCAAQRRCWHATPDVVRLCVLPIGDVDMPRLMSFDRLSFPKAMMACYARCSSTMCAAQR